MNSEARQALFEIASYLRQKKWTLSLAESCTGGLLSSWITAEAGVSDFYLGGLCSYANSAKEKILGVPAATLISDGAVSESAALAMATGARELFASSCSIAITGIAGPTGGTTTKPVGTVWIAVSGPRFEVSLHHMFTGDRHQIQNQSAQAALLLLLANIKKY